MDIAAPSEPLLTPTADTGAMIAAAAAAPASSPVKFDLDAALAAGAFVAPVAAAHAKPVAASDGPEEEAAAQETPDLPPPGNNLPPLLTLAPPSVPAAPLVPSPVDAPPAAANAAGPCSKSAPLRRDVRFPQPLAVAETGPGAILAASGQSAPIVPSAAAPAVKETESVPPQPDPGMRQSSTDMPAASTIVPPASIVAAAASPPSRERGRDDGRDQPGMTIESAAGGAVRIAFDRPGADPIGVTVERSDDGATGLRLAVTTSAIRDVFVAALPALADTLSARGVDVGHVAVDVDRRAPHRGGSDSGGKSSTPEPMRVWTRIVTAAARRAGFTAYA